MGSVYKRRNNYYIDYYDQNRKRKRQMIGPSKKRAEAVLHKRELSIIEGRYLDVKKNIRIKFEDFAEVFEKEYSQILNGYESNHKVHLRMLRKYFSGKYLHEINALTVKKFMNERSKTVEPATVNRAVSCLKSLFNRAIEWEKFEGKNPVSKVKMLKEPNGRTVYLEKEEISLLLSACSDSFRPIVLFAIHTGMRKGEILNLKWTDVDFKTETIYLLKTKSGKPREIPMNNTVIELLNQLPRHCDSEYVFCKQDGSKRKSVQTAFENALKRSGIKKIRFHDLRHTFASHAVMTGIDLNTVRELLGHASLTMTLRYSHLSPSHKKSAVDELCTTLAV
jgi:integrase